MAVDGHHCLSFPVNALLHCARRQEILPILLGWFHLRHHRPHHPIVCPELLFFQLLGLQPHLRIYWCLVCHFVVAVLEFRRYPHRLRPECQHLRSTTGTEREGKSGFGAGKQSYRVISCHKCSSGTGATTETMLPVTGCANSILRACNEMLPSGLERLAPYFRSPLMTVPLAASCTLI